MADGVADATTPWLVVGLGNPGGEYAGNRHNIGFMVVDLLAERMGGRFKAHKAGRAQVVEGRMGPPGPGNRRVVLAKPMSFMNLSGGPVTALRRLTRFSRFRAEERGAVLAETLIVVPFVTLFSVGILEFGNMFWQKHNIETGLRDAARFVARCQRTTTATFTAGCRTATVPAETVPGETVARRIAYRGSSDPSVTTLRVPGWTAAT